MKEIKESELKKESAILVGLKVSVNSSSQLPLEDSLEELALLAETAEIEVLGSLTQSMQAPHPRTFIGSGKVEELKMMATELGADTVIFDDELSPRHQRELEEELGSKIKVIDRTALILDIFAGHAETREGQLQVELAQLEYRMPRLTRAWTHLARQTGGASGRTGSVGGVGLRGPGETQLEVDRREIKKRIQRLKELIDKIRENRAQHRNQRKKTNIPVVALVGYTNAGKSTLLNVLARADIYTANQLFATLDPTTRQVQLEDGQQVLLTDTVGFIQKLPTQLIAAFRATLEEISESNLLVHVVDVSNPVYQLQKRTVLETLKEIEAADLPIITVYNKMDLLPEEDLAALRRQADPASVFISAKQGIGTDSLLSEISAQLLRNLEFISVLIPYEKGQLVSLFHEKGKARKVENGEKGVRMEGFLPKQLLSVYSAYRVKEVIK
ncbi:MAG: GTPase HflX [Anaerolineaceae bacterium]|nr:GTPase HflX [Anaerolineaceae bacterium]